MTSSIKTILVIGGTSGIGESFVRRFHALGKKVIVTGRRHDRLQELKTNLPGISTYSMDNTDLGSLPSHVNALFKEHGDIDTVWINSGIQYASDIKEKTSSTDAKIAEEITTNVTAPMILARHIIPLLVARGSESTFMATSSGLAFLSIPFLPVYNSTKSALHQYMVALRQSLADTKVNVVELVPPYVATDLDIVHREMFQGQEPMKLSAFTDEVFAVLAKEDMKSLKELAAGQAVGWVDAWRASIGEILKASGLGG